MKILLMLAALFATPVVTTVPTHAPPPPIGVSAIVDNGDVVAAFVTLPGAPTSLLPVATALVEPYLPGAATDPSSAASAKGQTLTTQVYDAVSDTYSDVVTVRGDNESTLDFIRRHNKVVDSLTDENVERAKARGIDYKAAKREHDHPVGS